MAVGNDRNLEQHSVIRRANVRSAFFKNNNCETLIFINQNKNIITHSRKLQDALSHGLYSSTCDVHFSGLKTETNVTRLIGIISSSCEFSSV